MAPVDPNAPITRKTLDEAVDTILKTVTRLLVGLAGEIRRRFDKVDDRLQRVEEELSSVQDGMKSSNAKLSSTPSRREFNELKARVDGIHPLS